VRLWNSYDLMQALLENYDQLSADIRTKLPLKRVWTLIDDEDIG
jgi:predicted Mrr-cat superfamily restriction endonuclease